MTQASILETLPPLRATCLLRRGDVYCSSLPSGIVNVVMRRFCFGNVLIEPMLQRIASLAAVFVSRFAVP